MPACVPQCANRNCLTKGFTCCCKSRRVPCAKSVPESDVFMPLGLALSLGRPFGAVISTQKLSQRTRWLRGGVARLESEVQRGLAAKADFSHWSVSARL